MDFSCKVCELEFPDNEQLLSHLSSEEHLVEENRKKEDSSEDIYCVFCCKLFDSIEKVELHVSEEHTIEEPENNNFLNGNMGYEIKLEPYRVPEKPERQFVKLAENKPHPNGFTIFPDKLTVYDVDLNVIRIDGTKLDRIKFCVRCNRHFDGEDNLRQHQLKDHAIRKRKRSTHPNGVEGIVVTGDGRWSCDVCGREFPTLKQAKVHKFKSHIEPIQKQELLSHDFTIRNNPGKDGGNEGVQLNNYYLQIVPNTENNALKIENEVPSTEIDTYNIENKVPQVENNVYIDVNSVPNTEINDIQQSSPVSDDSGNQIISVSEPRLDHEQINAESGSEKNSDIVDLSQSSSPKNVSSLDCETVWKIKSLDPEDTKISLSKIPMKFDQKPDNASTNEAYNFSTRHYVCPHCQASFGSRAVYSRHILVHRRGKAFACDKCGMAFTRNHTLKQHKDTKCVISNPVVGLNCQASDQCIKCGVYFASSNSHLSHCKKVCKISVNNQLVEDSSRDSVKSEETNAQYESQLEIDVGENENMTPVIINDFINNPAFVTKKINEFTCNLCCCYFASYKGIGQHLEQYHRIVVRTNLPIKPIPDIEKVTNIPNPIRTFASKEEMIRHQQQQSYISPKIINISKITPIEPSIPKVLEKPIKMEPKESPPQKLLIPSNFSLQNLVPMYSFEALNLSTSQPVSNISSVRQISPMLYKTQAAKKCKVPPNANGEFECKECHKTFGCRSSLSNHVKSHFNLKNKPFPCEDCKQGFMSQISYQEHRKSQCPKLYGEQASESNTSYSSPSVVYNLPGTSPSSASGRATCCMHCNASFPDRSLLEDHAAKEHSNENGEVMCLMCTRSFTTYMAFRVHMTKSHGGPNGTPLKSHLISSIGGGVSGSQIKKTLPQSPINSFPEFPYSNFPLNQLFSPLIRHSCQTCKMDFGTAQALETHKKACGLPIFSESNVSKDQLII